MNAVTMENRIINLFKNKGKNILNIYFTAGFPQLNDTVKILKILEKAGVDGIELGMPYSDPLADGPIIQQSSEHALRNGMSIRVLFDQIKEIRKEVSIPIMLMGYINPVMQYGIENFCKKCAEVGIDGLVLPDLPIYEYETIYKNLFEANGLSNIFLVTPQTSEDRLRKIDELSNGFIYIVSTNSTTGNDKSDTSTQQQYFERIAAAGLKTPTLIGFNIKDKATFNNACHYANGAIIGSAFVKMLEKSTDLERDIVTFIKEIKS